MNYYTEINQIKENELNNGQLYIYVLENYPQGNIKIGMSTNIIQRIKSLSGSNSGGNKIVKIAISPVTYLYTLEKIAHNHFKEYRYKGTEWFDGKYVSFENATKYIDSLFQSKNYQQINETRKKYLEQKLK